MNLKIQAGKFRGTVENIHVKLQIPQMSVNYEPVLAGEVGAAGRILKLSRETLTLTGRIGSK